MAEWGARSPTGWAELWQSAAEPLAERGRAFETFIFSAIQIPK